ncbi:Ionotropic glutamate receptor, L-glutamate and glycine-binding domain,Ionotropic glutamate [Cinara cedri]|uniref:Ionotropic glutamate receptor, L-glutamate and glycine-binding domain,Ionotropic glutamate n=1 Tax=Cinara cedri TaxID=506608 RepID=A0A5E4N664_9HEMI|nr:Ionotropic glutamate receptor, L-glutamate and glycine-binding domain,Ionotropic glutamate [Cinara cedri]
MAYFQTDFSYIQPVMRLIESYVTWLNITEEITFVFTNKKDANQAIAYLTSRESSLRAIVLYRLTSNEIEQLKNTKIGIRHVALIGNNLEQHLKTIQHEHLIKHDDSWIIVTNKSKKLKFESPMAPTSLMKFTSWDNELTDGTVRAKIFLNFILNFLKHESKYRHDFNCNLSSDELALQKRREIDDIINSDVNKNQFHYNVNNGLVTYNDRAIMYKVSADGVPHEIGLWTVNNGLDMKYSVSTIVSGRRFFRIGIAKSIPWTFMEDTWKGYCIDLIEKLAEEMNFKYELIAKNKFGEFDSTTNKWNGLIGGLVEGELDIVVASLTMTSDREEVIDFIAPYFDQSGISIVIRKPSRKTSLFKFMTVLKPEVWLSIVAALTVTAFMIWILDKYSPYSAQNNKLKYEQFRNFTLVESFWFALTSFTPQGGGETPKAISGRVLVAAYWVFVVLMLATFTANLAAFLTVERMQTPVQSLQQLARQSRINYSVIDGGDAHQFFQNMKMAEDILYNVWKEIALNQTNNRKDFRVWDYPIKEEFGQILAAIERTGTVPNRTVGYQMVLDNEQGEFALIHDSSDIKYEVYNNCNLTEVGETFAEKPYSIAVQQGSLIQEEISRKILDLQKDRFFELLNAKYWNASKVSMCPNADDSEGITLESLGGVFIATLVGLLIALITLAFEVIYIKHKRARVANVSSVNGSTVRKDQLMYSHELFETLGRHSNSVDQKRWANKIKLDSTTARLNNALFFRRHKFQN